MHLYLFDLHHCMYFIVYLSNQGQATHRQWRLSGLSFPSDVSCLYFHANSANFYSSRFFFPQMMLNHKAILTIGGHLFELQSRKIIDPLVLSQRVHRWGKIKNPLNSTIANNEPSLLKLQQLLIGFKVVKKNNKINHHQGLVSLCQSPSLCTWTKRGRAPSTGSRTGLCSWGNHPTHDQFVF